MTNGPTDTPSYRDARMHLKTGMVTNESSFGVGYGDVIILQVFLSESAFIDVNRCTKTFELNSSVILKKKLP